MLTIFTKRSRVLIMRAFWIYQSSEYASSSEDARVLIEKGFWICQGCEYASGSEDATGSEVAKVLNKQGLWICQRYTGFWICLNMSACICLYMSGYAQICLNGFCFIFPHCNQHTYFNIYTKLEVLVLRKMMFSWRYKFWFSYSSPNFICFFFQTIYFWK